MPNHKNTGECGSYGVAGLSYLSGKLGKEEWCCRNVRVIGSRTDELLLRVNRTFEYIPEETDESSFVVAKPTSIIYFCKTMATQRSSRPIQYGSFFYWGTQPMKTDLHSEID